MFPFVRSLRWFVALGCLGWGCAEDGPRGSPLENNSALSASLDPSGTPRLQLVEELRLDANAEDFSVVTQVKVGPGGQIVVSFRQDRQVRVYDPEGRRIATVGRPGSGPGEFQQVAFVGWTRDTIWVADLEAYRITSFAPDGGGLRTRQIPTPTLVRDGAPEVQLYRVVPYAIQPDQSIIGSAFYWLPDGSRISDLLQVMVPPQGPARLIAEPPSSEDPRWMMEVAGLGREVPFAMRPHSSTSHDGRHFASLVADGISSEGGTVTLTMVAASSDTLFVRNYLYVGVPVTNAQRDSALAEMLPEPGSPPPSEGPPDLDRRFHDLAVDRIPPVHAPITNFTLGLDGTIWLGLAATEAGRFTLVLNERGDPIGHVQLPGRSVLRQASATHVWVTEPDAVELNSVVRYRVVGLSP